MYLLERISLHNWYLLEGRDIDVRGSISVLGKTGTGKSAIMDAIQTVMSGNNRNIIRLNSAAGEARDRRVFDYCLGCVTDVDEGRPRRQRSETVLALSFGNPETGHKVGFGLLMTADEDEAGGERTLHRFVIRGHGFRLADFFDTDAGGTAWMPPHDVLVQRLKDRFGTVKDALTFHTNSQSFVQEYLTAMRPRWSPDPRRFLAAFSNALATREIRDPTDFIRRFVLERNPLNIRRVRESIATWRELQAEAVRLEDMIKAAKLVRARFIAWARGRLELQGHRFLATHAEFHRIEIEIKRGRLSKQAHESERDAADARVAELDAAVRRLEEENVRDERLAAGAEDSAQRPMLESMGQEMRAVSSAKRTQLLRSLEPYTRAVQFQHLGNHLPIGVQPRVQAAAELAALTSSAPAESWCARWADVGRLAAQVGALASADGSLRQQDAAAAEDLVRLRREALELDARISADAGAGSVLSPQTILFRQELTRRGIAAVALPDVVDVPETRWAFALEALLGAYREALIVPEDRLDEAFQILYRNRSQWDGCRLINTRKTRSARTKLPAGSIAEVAVTDNADARSFVNSHAGRSVRAEDEAELARLEQGIMPNGKTSQGAGLRVFRDRPPILGLSARAAALEAARQRRATVADYIAAAETAQMRVRRGLALLASLADAPSPPVLESEARELDDAVKRLHAVVRQIEESGTQDAGGRLAAIAERRHGIATARREQETLRTRAKVLSETIGGIDADIRNRLAASARLTEERSRLTLAQDDPRERALIALVGAVETIPLLRDRLDNRLELDWQGREEDSLRQEEAEARKRAAQGERELDENRRRADDALRRYLIDSERTNPLAEDAGEVDKLFWVDQRVEHLEHHQLLPHRARLDEARAEMELMLKEDLLAKLDERIRSVAVQLNILNRRLSGHTFVGQTYSFSRRAHERLKPLADLARHVAATPGLDFNALQSGPAPARFRSAMQDIERIVSSDEDVSEIEDYRNYFEFDLQFRQGDGKPVDFSGVLGKLSGGQRQAPYYVAIAASMMSVYFPGARAGDTDGMGLVLFDEAFNQLDVQNTRALLELFRRLGLQVLVAAPEANRPTFLESVDTIVTVARQPGTAEVYVNVSCPGPRAREAMQVANPEHEGIEGFRRRLAEMAADDVFAGG